MMEWNMTEKKIYTRRRGGVYKCLFWLPLYIRVPFSSMEWVWGLSETVPACDAATDSHSFILALRFSTLWHFRMSELPQVCTKCRLFLSVHPAFFFFYSLLSTGFLCPSALSVLSEWLISGDSAVRSSPLPACAQGAAVSHTLLVAALLQCVPLDAAVGFIYSQPSCLNGDF